MDNMTNKEAFPYDEKDVITSTEYIPDDGEDEIEEGDIDGDDPE